MATKAYQDLVNKQNQKQPFTKNFFESLDKLSYYTNKDKKFKQRKIVLSAGHSTKQGEDRGAYGNGYIEGIENAKIRKRVYEILKSKYNTEAIIDGDHSILKSSINFFTNLISDKKYRQQDVIALEIHFNAASSPKAKGVETIIPTNYTQFELELASEFSRAIAGILDTTLRNNTKGFSGVITEEFSRAKRLGWMRIPAENNLIEICFITNKEEMEQYSNNFERICQVLAAILYHNSITENA